MGHDDGDNPAAVAHAPLMCAHLHLGLAVCSCHTTTNRRHGCKAWSACTSRCRTLVCKRGHMHCFKVFSCTVPAGEGRLPQHVWQKKACIVECLGSKPLDPPSYCYGQLLQFFRCRCTGGNLKDAQFQVEGRQRALCRQTASRGSKGRKQPACFKRMFLLV